MRSWRSIHEPPTEGVRVLLSSGKRVYIGWISDCMAGCWVVEGKTIPASRAMMKTSWKWQPLPEPHSA